MKKILFLLIASFCLIGCNNELDYYLFFHATQGDDAKTFKFVNISRGLYSYYITFGDNSAPEKIAENETITHTYDKPGKYEVTLVGKEKQFSDKKYEITKYVEVEPAVKFCAAYCNIAEWNTGKIYAVLGNSKQVLCTWDAISPSQETFSFGFSDDYNLYEIAPGEKYTFTVKSQNSYIPLFTCLFTRDEVLNSPKYNYLEKYDGNNKVTLSFLFE